MNCPSRHQCWQSKRLDWGGAAGGQHQGKGSQEDCSATWLKNLRFNGISFMGLVMELVSGCLWPIILTQGPSWWCERHLANVNSSEKDSGRLVGHIDCCLLSPFDLSWNLPVSFAFLTKDFLFKITPVGGSFGAWLRQVVSPSVSPNKWMKKSFLNKRETETAPI